ncbi:MAG TPA: hypothetical protein VLE22_17895 [Bryobacteraceae bacterium]|nr:hypothetical protein [Bryobacteraceae bacterium]
MTLGTARVSKRFLGKDRGEMGTDYHFAVVAKWLSVPHFSVPMHEFRRVKDHDSA